MGKGDHVPGKTIILSQFTSKGQLILGCIFKIFSVLFPSLSIWA